MGRKLKHKKDDSYPRYTDTGIPIFLCYNKARNTGYQYYCRARGAEEKRCADVEHDQRTAAKQVILHTQNECIADLPLMKDLTPQQKKAAKELRAMAEQPVLPDTTFRDYVRRTQKQGCRR